jgi:hypothetical protein
MSKSLKSTTFTSEPVFVDEKGETRPYIAHEIKTARHALGATLDVIYKHTADLFLVMVTIMSEKTKLPVEEIMEAITTDPRYTDVMVNPCVNTLGYFSEKEGDAQVAAAQKAAAEDEDLYDTDEDVKTITKAVKTMTVKEPAPKKKVIKKTTKAKASAAAHDDS